MALEPAADSRALDLGELWGEMLRRGWECFPPALGRETVGDLEAAPSDAEARVAELEADVKARAGRG